MTAKSHRIKEHKLADTAEIVVLDKRGTEGRAESNSAKRGKFVRLAESRTRTAIRAIRVIAKLGNKNAYEYDDGDVKKIASALNREVEALRARMSASGVKETVDFKL